MLQSDQLDWDDTVLPFQLEKSDIRGRIARLDGVLNGVLRQHSYPPAVEALIAEMTIITALIGQTIKLRWKLSLQIQSKGAVRMIATDYYGPTEEGKAAKIRAYASYDADRLTNQAPINQVGEGYFAITIDQGQGMKPYQGITPLAHESLAANAQTYFAQSEQIPTRFSLSFGKTTEANIAEHWRAGGIMVQHMPKASHFVADDTGSGAGNLFEPSDIVSGVAKENWDRVNFRLDTVEEFELIGPTLPPKELLAKLFHKEIPRVFDIQTVQFGCTCSEARVRKTLSIYSSRDIEYMTTDDGKVTADCQFCGSHYIIDPSTVGFDAETKT